MIKIEKDIPIPNRRHKLEKYPFQEMEIGDSFLIAEEKRTSVATIISKRYTGQFVIRQTADGPRCWRVK